jgi:murein DD-endopeptidase MepM/ murein hydrolase activator NlpD
MVAPYGTNVYAALTGTVTMAGWDKIFGNCIIISHQSGYKTMYGHLSAILVTPGQMVTPSTAIGKVGSTGLSTGAHLHFTVIKNGSRINPRPLLPAE